MGIDYSTLRREGRKAYMSFMKREDHKIKGIRNVWSKKVGYLYVRERSYRIGGEDFSWTTTAFPPSAVGGVVIVPEIMVGGEDYVVMLLEPHPAIGIWALSLPAGAVERGETFEEAAIRELEEETGLKAGGLRFLFTQAHDPKRFDLIDKVFIAGRVSSGNQNREHHEKPIKTIMLSIPEIARLLDNDMIIGALTTSALNTYLRRRDAKMKDAFGLLKKR